jgi:putative flavoprotein involved in K+ transport
MHGTETERFETIVIGGGQAGLSVGYHLARRGRPFVILDARARIGDQWRERWDSLRLFTPARFNGLDGMPFPAGAHAFPTKDAMADYLEAYAARFRLPVRSGVEVDGLAKVENGYRVTAGGACFEADNVVVAMSSFQKPHVPAFARELDPDIVQVHSADYRRPEQLRDGAVLVVGAGNSGAEIAIEAIRHGHPTLLAGRDVGQIPFRIGGFIGRAFAVRLVLRVLFHRILTVDTPIGRKARPKVLSKGGPLIRTRWPELAASGVARAPRVTGVQEGRPLLADGRVLDVANVVWCTGFTPGFSWIDLPVLDGDEPAHERGFATGHPGLYFVGLHFAYALSSTMIHGVGRDAQRAATDIARRARTGSPHAHPTAEAVVG